MRQLRYRAVQIIDTISVASESLDEIKELQHVVLAVSVSPDTSLIIVVDAEPAHHRREPLEPHRPAGEPRSAAAQRRRPRTA